MKCYLAGTTVAQPKQAKKIEQLFKKSNKLHSFVMAQPGGFEREKEWFEVNIKNGVDLMLDSGAHSLYNEFVQKEKDKRKRNYAWSESKEFWDYVDKYAEFIKAHEKFLSCYINVDVIFNPEQSWEVLKYLENKHGLSPLPVVHYGTDLKWLQKHIDAGYDYIGLGGLGQEVSKASYFAWADKAFDMICDQSSRLPKVKIHGFAMTSLTLMLRYPWYSVDSTTWVVHGRNGSVIVPRFKSGEWVYDENSWVITVSSRSPSRKEAGKHIDTLSPRQREIILDYIHAKGYKLGKSRFKKAEQSHKLKENERWAEKKPKDKNTQRLLEIIEEDGLSNRYQLRDEINIIYFQDLEKSLPEWPWPFKRQGIKGFAL